MESGKQNHVWVGVPFTTGLPTPARRSRHRLLWTFRSENQPGCDGIDSINQFWLGSVEPQLHWTTGLGCNDCSASRHLWLPLFSMVKAAPRLRGRTVPAGWVTCAAWATPPPTAFKA